MPVHTVYTCDLCPVEARVSKVASDATVPLPEGWMMSMCECTEAVVPEEMDDIADAAGNLEGEAAQWGVACVSANMQPFFTTFYLCPGCQEAALGPLLPLFQQRLKERVESEAQETSIEGFAVVEGEGDPSANTPMRHRHLRPVPPEE